MNGEYFRVTPAELAHAITDPDWALDYWGDLRLALDHAGAGAGAGWEGADPALAKARCLSTHKAWHAIAYLLERARFGVDIVHGEEILAEEADWGYGPPHYLTVARVQAAAEALRATSFGQLAGAVGLADLSGAQIYPMIWDEPDALEWVRRWYEPLVPFFTAAASDGHAVLVWLS